jgi:hypothetical protein
VSQIDLRHLQPISCKSDQSTAPFLVSNKEQIIAIRYNDVVNVTNIVENILVKYKAA